MNGVTTTCDKFNDVTKGSLEMESVQLNYNPLIVSILGTGEFGRALGRKIFDTVPRSSIQLIFGTRNATQEQIYFVGAENPVDMYSHNEAILKSGEAKLKQMPPLLHRGHSNKIICDILRSGSTKCRIKFFLFNSDFTAVGIKKVSYII